MHMLYNETSLSIYLYDMCRYVHNVCASVYPQMYSLGFSDKTRSIRHGSQGFLLSFEMIWPFNSFFVELLMAKHMSFEEFRCLSIFVMGFHICYIYIYLGGGFKYVVYFHPYLRKWSNLTNIFQMGWNHQRYIYIDIIMMSIYILNIYTPEV